MLLPIPTNAYAPPAIESTILFKSNFNYATHDNGAVNAGYYIISGTETDTGFAWPGRSASYPNAATSSPMQIVQSCVECIHDVTTVTTGNINTLFGASFPSETGPSGGTEKILLLEMKDAGLVSWDAQMWLLLQRHFANTSPRSHDIDDFYVRYYFKYPTDLNSLANGGEIILLNEKTGGYWNGSQYHWGGDMRFSVRIKRPSAGGALYWSVEVDCGANGNSAGITTHTNGASWSVDDEYWKFNDSSAVPVPVNQWGKLELYTHKDQEHGFLCLAIDDQIVCRRVNRTRGEYNLPRGRMMLAGIYYTGTSPMNLRIAQLECRDYPPDTSVLHDEVRRYFYAYQDQPVYGKRSSARFYWPLRGSIAIQNGTGTPTFTRATNKWVFNDEGKVVKLPSGAIEMRGYRPVINAATQSENIAAAAWVKDAGVTTPNAYTLVCANATVGGQSIYDGSIANNVQVGQQWVARYRVEYVDIQYIQLSGMSSAFGAGQYCNFDLINGDYTATGCTAAVEYVAPGVWDISIIVTVTTSASVGTVLLSLVDSQASARADVFTGNGIKSVIVRRFHLENVSAASIKSASEYVSVGVLSAPYHGAGADGVKYFPTHKNGDPIPEADLPGAALNPEAVTNTLLYSRTIGAGSSNDTTITGSAKWISSTTGNNIVSNGTFDANTNGWTGNNMILSVDSSRLRLTSTIAGSAASAYVSVQTTPSARYVVSVDYVEKGVTGNIFCYIGTTAGSSGIVNHNIGGTPGTAKVAFTATSTTTYITIGFSGLSLLGEYVIVDNVECKLATVKTELIADGIDGIGNVCAKLTATAADAIILQTITAAAAAGCTGFYVKRSVGVGNIYITRDGGTTLTDITNQINSTDFTFCYIKNTSVTNPQVGFKLATPGDAIIADAGINHLGAQVYRNPLMTTSASVTVNAETLTATSSGNFVDTLGTVLATVTRDDWTAGNGSAVGSSTRGLYTNYANSGAEAKDGTSTASALARTAGGTALIGMRWSGSTMQAFDEQGFGAAAAYDGSFNLSSIAALPGVAGAIKDIAIWNESLIDNKAISALENI